MRGPPFSEAGGTTTGVVDVGLTVFDLPVSDLRLTCRHGSTTASNGRLFFGVSAFTTFQNTTGYSRSLGEHSFLGGVIEAMSKGKQEHFAFSTS